MNTKWYVIKAVPGKEKKAIEQLEYEVKERGFSDKVNQIVTPMEKVYSVRNGKKVTTERNHFPGYILVEADPSIIKDMSGLHKIVNFITGFIGGDNPTPLKQSEVERILGQMDILASSDEKFTERFTIGESIKIIDGPFNGFVGDVQEFNDDRKRLKVDVKVFGRSTPLELGYTQVQKSY
jgi:transcriptional antiterminator NusG